MDESAIRTAFEHWFPWGNPGDPCLSRDQYGDYDLMVARNMWKAWQVAYTQGRESALLRVD